MFFCNSEQLLSQESGLERGLQQLPGATSGCWERGVQQLVLLLAAAGRSEPASLHVFHCICFNACFLHICTDRSCCCQLKMAQLRLPLAVFG